MKNEKKVILVIEDERPLLKAIKTKLEQAGFDTVTAITAQQGLNMLKDIEHVDAIWLDHYLPGEKTGLDFLTEVKRNDAWKRIPVFIVTNTATAQNKYSYLQLGVDKYYVKSDVRLGLIIADIETYLSSQ